MISAVISGHLGGRIISLLAGGLSWGVVHHNARIFYSRMHGTLSKRWNNFIMFLAILSIISLPLAGVFDTHNHRHIHRPLIIIYMFSFIHHVKFVADAIVKHKYLYSDCD